MSISNLRREDFRSAVIYSDRQLPADGTARRWAIWALQSEQGQTPCFATASRFTCASSYCPWWQECQGLRAEWKR